MSNSAAHKARRRWRFATFVLAGLLVWSNGWWLYHAVDAGVTQKFVDQEQYILRGKVETLFQLVPPFAEGRTKEDIVALAAAATGETPFEKDGATWVGTIGLVFTDSGRLDRLTDGWGSFAAEAAR